MYAGKKNTITMKRTPVLILYQLTKQKAFKKYLT